MDGRAGTASAAWSQTGSAAKTAVCPANSSAAPPSARRPHIWVLYEITFASGSISYAAIDKYPLPATAKRPPILIGTKVQRVAGRLTGRSPRKPRKEQPMLDVILLAVGLGFFALSIAYAFGCDRL